MQRLPYSSTSGMKFEMSELPPGLVWKWKIRSCFSQTSKHSSAIARVSSSHVPGSGLPPSRKVVFSADDARLGRELQRLARHLRVARQERDPDRGEDAVVGRRRLHHDVVEVERDLVHRDAVVRHRERALDLELVHVVLHELGRRAVVVDRRLDRVLEVVELPRRDLADVAVRVDDPLRVRRGHGGPFRRSSAPGRCAPPTPRACGRCWAGMSGGWSTQPRAGRRVELDDLELERRDRAGRARSCSRRAARGRCARASPGAASRAASRPRRARPTRPARAAPAPGARARSPCRARA